MVLTVNDLPSGGYFGSAPPIAMTPFTFLEVLEYNNYVADDALKKYTRDLKYLVKMDPGVLKHSLYDLDYLIFMMKVHTIADNVEFTSSCTCRHCGHDNVIHFDLGNFKFKDISKDDKKVQSVLMNGVKYKVKVPTIEHFLSVLEKYNLYQKVSSSDVVKLISLFPEFQTMPNDIEDAVFDANRDDISVLYYLETLFLTSVEPVFKECTKCKNERGMAIRIESLIANMFRDILLNNASLESKILFE
jgi:hypothetical protein